MQLEKITKVHYAVIHFVDLIIKLISAIQLTLIQAFRIFVYFLHIKCPAVYCILHRYCAILKSVGSFSVLMIEVDQRNIHFD